MSIPKDGQIVRGKNWVGRKTTQDVRKEKLKTDPGITRNHLTHHHLETPDEGQEIGITGVILLLPIDRFQILSVSQIYLLQNASLFIRFIYS